jgi:hypothetical protein
MAGVVTSQATRRPDDLVFDTTYCRDPGGFLQTDRAG